MTISEIKSHISKECGIEVPSLDFYQQFDMPTEAQVVAAITANPTIDPKKVDGDPLPWAKAWIKTHRIAIVMHMETLLALQADKGLATLSVKDVQLVHPNTPDSYRRYVIVISTKMLASF